MTPVAKELIHRLRHDDHVRSHFDMSDWIQAKGCRTVGCIGGQAMLIANHPVLKKVLTIVNSFEEADEKARLILQTTSEILGLEYPVAPALFMPWEWSRWLCSDGATSFKDKDFKALWARKPNYRCDLTTLEKMKKWARDRDYDIDSDEVTPDRAAHALEAVIEDHPGYVDWQRAFEEA